jgi:hypothetical protein
MTFLSGDVGPSARAEVQPDGSLVVQSGTERGVGGREIHLGVEAGESIVRRVIGARARSRMSSTSGRA